MCAWQARSQCKRRRRDHNIAQHQMANVMQASGTKLLVIVWLKDRCLSVWTSAARANHDHATLLLCYYTALIRDPVKKAFEFATEVITSLRDLVRNIHFSPLLMDQTALTWKPGRNIVPWMNYPVSTDQQHSPWIYCSNKLQPCKFGRNSGYNAYVSFILTLWIQLLP